MSKIITAFAEDDEGRTVHDGLGGKSRSVASTVVLLLSLAAMGLLMNVLG